jgi:nicotinate-nucleotide--dimethylbenzimidazole phosphoribosyltransferase
LELPKAELQEVEPFNAMRDDPARFLRELRQLRAEAGLELVELAARAHYPCDVIRAAEAGPSLPSLPVLSAYVRGCGGTPPEWEERWRSLTRSPASPLLPVRSVGESDAAVAGARIGAATPAADGHDPGFIMAALGRVADGIAAESSSSAAGAGFAAVEAGVTISDAVSIDAASIDMAALETPPWAGSGTMQAALSPDAAPGNAPARDTDPRPATVPGPAAPQASAAPSLPGPLVAPGRASAARSLPSRAMPAALIAVAVCLLVVLLALFA